MSGNSDKEVEELPRLINLSTMSEFDNYHFAKGAQKIFTLAQMFKNGRRTMILST